MCRVSRYLCRSNWSTNDVIVSGGFVPSHGQSGRLLAFKFASKNPHHVMYVWPRTLSFICIFTSLGAVPYQTLKVLTNKVSYK